MKKIILFVFLLQVLSHRAQDTFSILAYDSITGEVGGAGASCVDLFNFPSFSNHFIIELFPDTGAVACQASYLPANQASARSRMRAGDAPQQLMSYMSSNDAGGDPSIRQYGALRRNGSAIQTAAFTGSACVNYKNHIVGPNYTIHGNILQGQKVLDSMEARFNREKGALACKLMAAMQGAKMVGADSRCAGNNSSALFAFLKVSLPTDSFGKPYFLISLKTAWGDSIEPIDSLQNMFSRLQSCEMNTSGLTAAVPAGGLSVFPNPAHHRVELVSDLPELLECRLSDILGREIARISFAGRTTLDVSSWDRGLYMVELNQEGRKLVKRLILTE